MKGKKRAGNATVKITFPACNEVNGRMREEGRSADDQNRMLYAGLRYVCGEGQIWNGEWVSTGKVAVWRSVGGETASSSSWPRSEREGPLFWLSRQR